MQAWLNQLSDHLSVWTTVRAAGLTSYLLLFAAVAAGLLQGEVWAGGKRRAQLQLIHQWCGWFGLLFGVIHGLALTFDSYVGYSLVDILIPFASHDEPVWTALGILSLYLLLLIMASSDLMRTIGKKLWRAIHFLALPTFIMALLHGIMLGSDSSSHGIQTIYVLSALIVGSLTFRRIYMGQRIKKNKITTSIAHTK